MLGILATLLHCRLYCSLVLINPYPYCKWVDVTRRHCPLCWNYLLAISIVGLILFFSQIGSHITNEIILKLWFVCWPWIVYRWLSQVVQKTQYKHFNHHPIYIVILQVINKCLVSYLCLVLCIYILKLYSIHKMMQVQI
jgi:hypothetical protein